MKAKEAKELLKTAKPSETKESVMNSSLTQKQAFDIINDCVQGKPDDACLPGIIEKRVYQVVRNQRQPRYQEKTD